MNVQDWYLKQFNITQYILRNPAVLKGEIATQIGNDIRLIVVTNQPPTQKIYFDILKAIQLNEDQVIVLTPSQLIMPTNEIQTVVWFIDVKPDDAWLNQLTIQTISLDLLASAPQQKRQLWQQLCQYENYFHPERT
ncbi:DNA polymerase III subunit psi [Gilliamella sp. wkB112]|uniref:DNA polymerase III subunit psi n=1 Tax=Gilliamella sp. wkB112 TaxID=3120257 RepID=UPI00080EB165|nr:DNA polymerase III subunit psi [Gilliamella apicola]OCG03153.1 hypothetical protein A9G12_09585 [Gilliamella apicola]